MNIGVSKDIPVPADRSFSPTLVSKRLIDDARIIQILQLVSGVAPEHHMEGLEESKISQFVEDIFSHRENKM